MKYSSGNQGVQAREVLFTGFRRSDVQQDGTPGLSVFTWCTRIAGSACDWPNDRNAGEEGQPSKK